MLMEVSLGNSPVSLVKLLPRLSLFGQGCKYYFFYILKGEVVIIYAMGTSLDNSPMSLFELLSRKNWSLFHKAVIIIFCLRERLL